MTADIRRTLSPREWLNRCLLAYGDEALLPSLDVLPDQDEELLKFLGEKFENFDAYIGSREGANEDPIAVKRCRTVLGSLKKFRDPVGGVDRLQLQNVACKRYKANNLHASANVVPERFVPFMREFLSTQLAGFWRVMNRLDGTIIPRFGNHGVEEQLNLVERWEAVADQNWFDFRDPLNVLPELDAAWFTRSVSECCRLCAVPKDWNKLRLITIEPYALTYLQQTTRTAMLHTLASSQCGDLRALARAEIQGSYDPQIRHRKMALRGSMDGSLATLDLSDASDHVSWQQVCQVFPSDVLMQLERARSRYWFDPRCKTDCGEDEASGQVHMFAGMGNACTFVVETLMFHAACYAVAKYHRLKSPWSISVFGDDIVCATQLAQLLVDTDSFSEFGWTINWAKSFYTPDSRFRESCGVQAYQGKDVTLLRYMGGFDRPGTGLVGLCALLERIEELGLNDLTFLTGPWQECQGIPNLWCKAASGIYTHVPWWPETAGDLGVEFRKNKALQRKEVKLLHPLVKRRFVRTRRLGVVYGALSGQLRQKSAVQGRAFKRAGIWIDDSTVDSVTPRWTPLTEPYSWKETCASAQLRAREQTVS